VKAEHSSLWIVTRGSVEVAESGQVLGTLETSGIFGDSVAFGRCDQQPFSVTPIKKHIFVFLDIFIILMIFLYIFNFFCKSHMVIWILL
jgi:hypothetical protein